MIGLQFATALSILLAGVASYSYGTGEIQLLDYWDDFECNEVPGKVAGYDWSVCGLYFSSVRIYTTKETIFTTGYDYSSEVEDKTVYFAGLDGLTEPFTFDLTPNRKVTVELTVNAHWHLGESVFYNEVHANWVLRSSVSVAVDLSRTARDWTPLRWCSEVDPTCCLRMRARISSCNSGYSGLGCRIKTGRVGCVNWDSDPKGLDYRGALNIAHGGDTCMKWTDTPMSVEEYPGTGLGNHNYCRNPTRDEGGPWCATSVDGTHTNGVYCDPAACPSTPTLSTPESFNGGWSSWEPWGVCSAACGVGTQTWTRTCTDPPPVGRGAGCEGSGAEARICNEQPCEKESERTEPVALLD